ncbi:Glycosyl hydrolase family 26 domain containing protein [Fimbriimonadaceae bacterium]
MSARLPVSPNPSVGAVELLSYLYEINGKATMSGQHNQLYNMSNESAAIQALTGKYPKVWGGEWGFSDERHDIDNIAYRPKLMSEIRRHHAMGGIVVITYHQADPRVGEPCDFDPGVIGNLTEPEWDELFDSGSKLHAVWLEHVDRLAEAFKELQAEGIPIIFRPYHEMNGGWFWWGGDAPRFLLLWKMIFDRYVGHHGLTNLLWAWNPDKPWPGVEEFYPGHDTVDLLGTDIYPGQDRDETYPEEWYERMKGLAEGRPLALSENSELPTAADLERQPWAYFMGWDNLTLKANSEDAIRATYSASRVISI